MDFFEIKYYAENIASQFANSPFAVLWISLIIAGACYAVLFALQAIALYTIGKREGYKHRWMAFIPFFNSYYMGVVAEKNKFYNFPTKVVSLTLAIVEFVLVLGYVVSTSVEGIVFAGGLYDIQLGEIMGQEVVIGYVASGNLQQICPWMAWIFNYLDGYVLTWLNLLYVLLHVLVVISFFQTYACRRYFIMSLMSLILPVRAILMFAVRKNTGMRYSDYIRGEQRRRYEMYQQYSSQNGAYGGYNPYSGRPTPPPSNNAYSGGSNPSPGADDPFDGLGSNSGSSGGSGGDPFDD